MGPPWMVTALLHERALCFEETDHSENIVTRQNMRREYVHVPFSCERLNTGKLEHRALVLRYMSARILTRHELRPCSFRVQAVPCGVEPVIFIGDYVPHLELSISDAEILCEIDSTCARWQEKRGATVTLVNI